MHTLPRCLGVFILLATGIAMWVSSPTAAVAQVRVVSADSAFQRVRCSSGFTCSLARGLLHDRVTKDSLEFRLESADASTSPGASATAPGPTVNSLQLVLFGARSREIAPVDPHTPAAPLAVSAEGVLESYIIHRLDLPADHYRGEVLVLIDGKPATVRAAAGLDVRHGPGLPLLLLLLGLLGSRTIVRFGSVNGTTPARSKWTKPLRLLAGFDWEHKAPHWGVAALAWASGVPWKEGSPWMSAVRAGSALTLLVAVVVQGIELLYVADGAFGDAYLFDHAKIFLWPFTADIATRALGHLGRRN